MTVLLAERVATSIPEVLIKETRILSFVYYDKDPQKMIADMKAVIG